MSCLELFVLGEYSFPLEYSKIEQALNAGHRAIICEKFIESMFETKLSVNVRMYNAVRLCGVPSWYRGQGLTFNSEVDLLP